MKIICSKIVDDIGNIKFLYFNTEDKKIYYCLYDEILKNINSFYGVSLEKKILKFNKGYKVLPTLDYRINIDNQLNFYSFYTVVGKFINKKEKYYLLVRADNQILKLKENEVINLNRQGKITNIIQSDNYVKLKQGSIPMFTKERKETLRIEDTVIKIKDIDELKELMTNTGVGKKFLGYRKKDNRVGMVKHSVSPNLYDNINEVMSYELGKLFDVPVCEASFETYKRNNHYVISIYEYNYETEKIESGKTKFGTDNFHSRFTIKNIEKFIGPEAVIGFNKMVLFDLITNQTDRHISNFAFFKGKLYPLYDNGRCLFWNEPNLEDIKNEDLFSTFFTNEHGFGWSYVDGVLGVAECRKLLNCNVLYSDIENIVMKYYKDKKRAKILSRYMYRVYKFIIGGDLNVR